MTFEYKVVPAPTRGKKAKGIRSSADRFANALSAVINDHAADGWEYLRTDTLPAEERQGLTGRTTVFRNMLVFRRPAEEATEAEPAESGAVTPVLETEPAESHAPKLPSAETAQDVPPPSAARLGAAGRRDVAAE